MKTLSYDVLKTFCFENYPVSIVVANARRATYHEQGKPIPKKYSGKLQTHYVYKRRTVNSVALFEIATNTFVVKNSKTAGTPRTKVIRGQSLHELTLTTYDRSKILTTLKRYFVEKMLSQGGFKGEEFDSFPYTFIIRYVLPRNQIEDLDNHNLFYHKVLQDCCVTTKIIKTTDKATKNVIYTKEPNVAGFIKDDNVDFLNRTIIEYKESDDEKRYIIFHICKPNYKFEKVPSIQIKAQEVAYKLAASACYEALGLSEEQIDTCKEGILLFKTKYDYYFDTLINSTDGQYD